MAARDPVDNLLHLMALPPATGVVFDGDAGHPTCAACASRQCAVRGSFAQVLMEKGQLRLAVYGAVSNITCWVCNVQITTEVAHGSP